MSLAGVDQVDLAHILDGLREGIQVLSPEWRYLYVNQAVATHGRRSRDELLGRTMPECYPGIEKTPVFATLERCMRERRAESFENEFEYPDGQRAWFELRIQPCREGLVVLSLDISERRNLERQLRESHKLRALGQMAAGVVHDLRNILNPIALEVQAIRRHLGDERQAAEETLERIEAAVRAGADIVDQLRSFSRQEPDGAARTTELNRVVDSAVELCRARVRELRGVELRRERGEAPPALLRASELFSAVVNLVVNAADAIAGSEGGAGTITVTTGTADGGGWVEVADDGPGMLPEVERRAFEPFFTTKQQGTGLGLSMVYAMARRHGGEVRLDTGAGRGTRVRLWFPACAPAAEAPAPAPTGPAESRGERSRRLLVVEDEAPARDALGTLLAEDGFTVETAESGEQAMLRLQGFEPGALIVDVGLPGMNGVAVARRARERRPTLPVVLISGYDETHESVAALLHDPNTAHVTKPVDLARLMAALQRVTGQA